MVRTQLRQDQIQRGGCCRDDRTAIRIGGGKSIEEAADAIIGILETTVDQETMRKALDTLAAMCSIKNVAITGNYITMGECRCKDGEEHKCRRGKGE